MKKAILALVVVAVLIGAGWWVLSRQAHQQNNSIVSKSGNSSASPVTDSNTGKVGFDALANNNNSFVATINNTANGKTTVSTMEYDKSSGNVRYKSPSPSQMVIYTKNAYYLCQDAKTCFKYDLNGSNKSGFDPSDFQYSADKLAALKNSAIDKGIRNCMAGSCRVWQVTSGNYSSEVYVDTKTKLISEVTGVTATGSYLVTFEYKSVKVNPPAKVQSLPKISPQ